MLHLSHAGGRRSIAKLSGGPFCLAGRFRSAFASAGSWAYARTAALCRHGSSASSATTTFTYSLSEDELRNQQQYPAVHRFIEAYRTHGHVEADVDPLKRRKRSAGNVLDPKVYGLDKFPSDKRIPLQGLLFCSDKKEATIPEIERILKSIYSGSLGVEYSHLETPEEQLWFARCFERLATGLKLSAEAKRRVNELLQKAEVFDHYLHMKFRAVKRYGLEGCESMMPCMDTIFRKAAEHSVQEIVISMPHRGRLNLLTGMLDFPSATVFSKVLGFSDAPELANVRGTGDVLSHIAQSVDMKFGDRSLHVSLIHNPSHLEASNPVAMGKVRCKQDTAEGNGESVWNRALCVMVHGDAAVSGQGIVAETLGMSRLPDYTTGGAIHVVVNNQLGFTTDPWKGRSSWYCTDVGKMVHAPALHVNADDPEAVVLATQVAMEYRQRWFKDVFLDLNGYRRHGHNELDEPSFTQPTMYENIRARPTLPSLYADKLVQEKVLTAEDLQRTKDGLRAELDKQYAVSQSPRPGVEVFRRKWTSLSTPQDMTQPVETGVPSDTLIKVGLASIDPRGKILHPRLLSNFCTPRKTKLETKDKIDWATAEALAFGSLLLEGFNVRLSGQDVGRGTFSHRHVRLVDQKTDEGVVPLNFIGPSQGKLTVADSPLSELAVMGFEYGYSIEDPNTLTLWEAQFGDFSNGAQIVIDQFLSSGEDKWWRQSGLVLLLPHGFDGAGPEHSSCRMERYLQLCDGDALNMNDETGRIPNMQVVYPTTPANYFHLLRRQLKRRFRKPLVVVGPKTMLRSPEAVSPLAAMCPSSSFQSVLTDDVVEAQSVDTVVFCSGKLYYDLAKEREQLKAGSTALVRLEELSPFPYAALSAELSRYPNAKRYRWVQEEPQNMGAWSFVMPRFLSLFNTYTLPLQYVGRPAAAAPAVGLASEHKKQHAAVVSGAFQ